MARAPIAAQIQHITVAEGRRIDFLSPEGGRTTIKLQSHSASAKFSRADIKQRGAQQLLDAATELGGAMAEGIETELIELMKSAPSTAGGVFSGSTPEEMGQEFLRGLEAIDFGFDDDGAPTIFAVVSPEQAARMADFDDSELRAKADLIVARKRDEWRRRESHRRLAD
jgi:hypothetical protein